jgi:hypothetical protein
MTTVTDMIEEIKQEIANGSTLEDITNRSHEYVDNYVPVYNSDIIKEWQDMPGHYDDEGASQLGSDGTIGIVGLMTLDLYVYYTDQFGYALELVTEELEDVA